MSNASHTAQTAEIGDVGTLREAATQGDEFVQAACRVMQANPGFTARDYEADGITAEDFEAFFTHDMNEAWSEVKRLKAALANATILASAEKDEMREAVFARWVGSRTSEPSAHDAFEFGHAAAVVKAALAISPADLALAAEGWALVPCEPTREMLSAWMGYAPGGTQPEPTYEEVLRTYYRRMLDYRPAPPLESDLREALTKINGIRNSIIGLQKLNWSEHVYPLVAALDAAGFEGMDYPEAREHYGTLLERAIKAEDELSQTRNKSNYADDCASAEVSAAKKLSQYFEESLTKKFVDAHGQAEGMSRLSAMVNQMKSNIAEDSGNDKDILFAAGCRSVDVPCPHQMHSPNSLCEFCRKGEAINSLTARKFEYQRSIARDAAARASKNTGVAPEILYAPILWAIQYAGVTPTPTDSAEDGDMQEVIHRVRQRAWEFTGNKPGSIAWENCCDIIEAKLAALAASPAPRAPAAGVPDELRRLENQLFEAEKVIQSAHMALWFDLRDMVVLREPISDQFNQAVRDVALKTKAYLEGRRTLAAAPAAPPADGGTEGLRTVIGEPFITSVFGDGRPYVKLKYRTSEEVHAAHDALSDLISSRTPAGAAFACVARRGSMGANDPQECDWPVCGCDPHADKVIASLQESGHLVTPAGGAGDPLGEDDAYEAAWDKYRWAGGPGYTDNSASTAFLEGWNAALAFRPATPAPAASAGGTPASAREGDPCTWAGGNDTCYCLKCGAEYRYGREDKPVCPRALARPAAPAEDVPAAREATERDYVLWRNRRGADLPVPPTSLEAFKAGWKDAIIASRPTEPGGARGEIVRHVKRGTEYEVLGEAMGQQLDEYGEPHPHSLVIYRKVGSKRLSWILPAEFPNHFVPTKTAARPASNDTEGA